jgi:hypothetical protein
MIWQTLLLVVLAPATGSAAPACRPDREVTKAIAEFRDTRAEAQRDLLARRPDVAACHLVHSLHVVRDTHVAGYEQDRHPDTMQVIWALRALRYLTGCKDFRAPTAEDVTGWEETRRGFLLRDERGVSSDTALAKPGVKFFQTWMSRDSVFIAPPDAQRAIITQWVQWYREAGSHGFEYRRCEPVDAWYF